MRIKKVFPKMLLALGLVSIILVSMPAGVAYPSVRDGPATANDSDVQAWEAAGWTVKKTENTDTGDVSIAMTHIADEQTHGEQLTTHIVYNTETDTYEEERISIWRDGSVHTSTYEGTVNGVHYKTSETVKEDGKTWRQTFDHGRLTSDSYDDGNGNGQKTDYSADGSFATVNKWAGGSIVTYSSPDGSSTMVFIDSHGFVTSVTTWDKDGNKKTASFSGDCVWDLKHAAEGVKIIKGPDCHRTSLTTYDVGTGKTVVTNYDPDGNVISGTPTGSKDQIKADVLGQIEGKPNGDLMDDKTQLPAAMTQQPGKSNTSVQPMPIGALPVGKSGISSVIPGGQSTGKVFQSGDSAEKKLPAGVLGHIDKTGGKYPPAEQVALLLPP